LQEVENKEEDVGNDETGKIFYSGLKRKPER
jgi:hypothetical protein